THMLLLSFLFHDTATPQTYTLSLHDALPIWTQPSSRSVTDTTAGEVFGEAPRSERPLPGAAAARNTVAAVTTANASEVLRRRRRSEEHTSELQSRRDLVCRLLLEKKKASPAG